MFERSKLSEHSLPKRAAATGAIGGICFCYTSGLTELACAHSELLLPSTLLLLAFSRSSISFSLIWAAA